MSNLLNPYIAGAPVTESSMFFGREDVFRWIEDSLTGKFVHHILVIHGQRRVGKTSILKQIPNYLPKTYLPIYFDLQGRTNTTIERFLWWLGREITRAVRQQLGPNDERMLNLPVPEQEAFSHDPDYLINTFFPSLLPILGEQTLLLTFDEFDTLDQVEVRETLAQPFVTHLRRLFDMPNLNFIFSIGSSGHKLENMQASYTEFFKTALYRKISFLQHQDCLQLVTRPVAGVLEFEPAAVERIYQITSGHPYFTQLTCHELFALCQKTDRRQIKLADVNSVLEDVIERGTVNLKFVWDEASDLEKWVLSCLAQSDGPCDQKRLEGMLRSQRVRTTEHDITAALIHLRDKDVLTQDNSFMIELLRIWMQKNRPFDRVREELVEVNPIANRYIEIGDEYRDLGQTQKARESFNQALAIDPANLHAQLSLAALYLAGREYPQAVNAFELALAIDEEDITARSGLCSANLALGDAAIENIGSTAGQIEQAIPFYQHVLEISPDHPEARQRLAYLHARLAENALSSGQDERALNEFKLAQEFAPEDTRLAARYAQVLAEKKARLIAEKLVLCQTELDHQNWSAAQNAIQEALHLSPGDPLLQNKLVEVKEQGRRAQLKTFRQQADQAINRKDWQAAIHSLENYQQLAPEIPTIADEISTAKSELYLSQLALLKTQAETQQRNERWDEVVQTWEAYLSLMVEQHAQPEQLASAREALGRAQRYHAIANTYIQAQAAIKEKRYNHAIGLLQGIIAQDASYKEAALLLVECLKVRPKRQIAWGRIVKIAVPVVVLALAVVGIFSQWKWISTSISQLIPHQLVSTNSPHATATTMGGGLSGQGVKVCEITDLGGISDKSFNEITRLGLNMAQKEWGVETKYYQSNQESDYRTNIEQAVKDGCDLIVTVGYAMGDATKEMAAKYPQIKFSTVDFTDGSPLANVMDQNYKVWEGAFLAGYLAAGLSNKGAVGTFGALDVPVVTVYMDGFTLGVEYFNQVKGKQVKVLGWDATKQQGLFMTDMSSGDEAKQLTANLISQGADILMPIVGGTPLSMVIGDAQYKGAMIIGVDTDIARQYPQFSDTILTSVVKRADLMVMEAIKAYLLNNFGGTLTGNLQNEGVELGVYDQDGYFKDLGVRTNPPAGLGEELAQLKQDVIDGKVATTPQEKSASILADKIHKFADPIVQADVKNRTPDFSDAFDTQDATWELGQNVSIDPGELKLASQNDQDAFAYASRLASQDFALEFNFRTYLISGTTQVGFNFREIPGQERLSGYHFELIPSAKSPTTSNWTIVHQSPQGSQKVGSGNTDHYVKGNNHLLFILQGNQAAVYLNDQPMLYQEDLAIEGNLNSFQFDSGQDQNALYIDEVKLWHLGDYRAQFEQDLLNWQPDFADDFSTTNPAWVERPDMKLDPVTQKYVLTLQNSCTGFATDILTADNFALQFEVTPLLVEGESGYGLEFRNTSGVAGKRTYWLSFNPGSQKFDFLVMVPDNTDSQTPASASGDEFGLNKPVSVFLLALDDNLTYSLNGGTTKVIKDSTWATGTNSFFACTVGNLKLAFDNIKFWNLDGRPWIESFGTMEELRTFQPIYNYIQAVNPQFREQYTILKDPPKDAWWAKDLQPSETYTLTEGTLELGWQGPESPSFGYTPFNGKDFALQVDFLAQQAENQDMTFGIMFRSDTGQYFLDFHPQNNGWKIASQQGDIRVEFQQGQSNDIQFGKWVRLLLFVRGDEFAAYLNGQSMFFLQDQHWAQGRNFIHTWAQGSAKMRFDNIQFWDIAQFDWALPEDVQLMVGNRPPDLENNLASLVTKGSEKYTLEGALLAPMETPIGDKALQAADYVLKMDLRLNQTAPILFSFRLTEFQGGAIGTEYIWNINVNPQKETWTLVENLNSSSSNYTTVASGGMEFFTPGEWVTLVIVVTGDSFLAFANGIQVATYTPLKLNGVINHFMLATQDPAITLEVNHVKFWRLK